MNQPDPQQEPTMEEILASIRRIISEEGEEGEEAGKDEAAKTGTEPTSEKPAVEDKATEEPPSEEPAVEEPIDDGNVLELTEIVEDGEPAEDLAEEEPAPEPEPQPEPEEVVFQPEDEPAPEPEPEPEPTPAPVVAPAGDTGLVSEPVAQAATSSFADLGGAVQAARGLAMGEGQRTLEDVVKELLRPMLKEWLDENLAGIVQRIVEREVIKLAGRADDGGGDLTGWP